MSSVETQKSYRVLWAQVVLQAKADIENEPIGSVLFNQAAAFFVSRGEWAESRATVADCLEMHPDDLFRCGERWIAARRQREGLPPEPRRDLRPQAPLPLPRLVATPAPSQPRRKARQTVKSLSINPFHPHRANAVTGA